MLCGNASSSQIGGVGGGGGGGGLWSAPRTPTNIHGNCSLREINTSDKFPMPPSGAVMKVCVCVCVKTVVYFCSFFFCKTDF